MEQFIFRHAVPEVCIMENGGEFISVLFQDYLHGLGIITTSQLGIQPAMVRLKG